MCLTRVREHQSVTAELRASKKPVIGYKLLKHWDGELGGELLSPFFNHVWTMGVNVSSRSGIKQTDDECRHDIVDAGFHFFRSYEDATKSLASGVIGIFEIQPEDIVAAGMFERYESFVAIKATLKTVVNPCA